MSESNADYEGALRHLEADDVDGLEARLRTNPGLVNARGQDGDTLLHWACHKKSPELVELLLEAGADPNARGSNGRTPLHAAVNDTSAARALPIVQKLLARSAVPTQRDDNGFSAIEWAKQEVWEPQGEVIALLGKVRPLRIAPPVRDDVEDVARRVFDIEARSHTELDLWRLLESYIAANGALPAAGTLAPATDREAIAELRDVLSALERTSWATAVRELLRDSLKPADVRRLVALYWEKERAEK